MELNIRYKMQFIFREKLQNSIMLTVSKEKKKLTETKRQKMLM